MSIVIIEIPNMARAALTDAELASLPDDGLVLWDEPTGTRDRCPPGGCIRQRRRAWNWHPTFDHALDAAARSGERSFIVGDGCNVEVPAK